MFTGIIQTVGKIRDIDEKDSGDKSLWIQSDMDLGQTAIGASICCSGCCLTVVEKTQNAFLVDVSNETLSKTNLGDWQIGAKVNIEPSLKMGDEMGGHIVSGHVDGLAKLTAQEKDGGSWRLSFEVPESLAPMIASKGSVALDGISLTVNEVEGNNFGVNIIPHTWDQTTIGTYRIGDFMNLEIDVLARYVARIIGKA